MRARSIQNLFVTVGSTDCDELVEAVDRLIPGLRPETAEMQIGHGRYRPNHARCFRFAPSIEPYLRRASLVIAHGGLGATTETLGLGVPLVSFSNPDRYDVHQDDLLAEMESRAHLVWCRRLEDLSEAIERALSAARRPYGAPECHIHRVIEGFLAERW